MKARIAMHTDKGPRENLEDAAGAFSIVRHLAESTEIHGLAMLDGVCGVEGGELASNIGLRVIEASLAVSMALASSEPATTWSPEAIQEALHSALLQANEAIVQQVADCPELQGMATTVVLALIDRSTLYVGSAGDSRCYRVGQRHIQRITRDHTEISRLLAAGLLRNEEEAKDHPMAHAINRFLGQPAGFAPDLHVCPLDTGDMIILCSDGLTDAVHDQQILDAVNSCRNGDVSFKDLPHYLVDLALDKGTTDNCTVLCCECSGDKGLPTRVPEWTSTGAYPVLAARVLKTLKESSHERDRLSRASKAASRRPT